MPDDTGSRDRGERDVLSSLPAARPQRRSSRRGSRQGRPRVASKRPPTGGGSGRPARTASGQRQRKPAGRKPAAVRPSAATARAKPRPGSPAAGTGARRPATPPQRDLIGATVDAAGELVQLGLSVGVRALREAAARIPRP